MSNNSQIRNTPINFSASGDNVVIGAVAAKLIEVVSLYLVVGGSTNLTFKDSAGTSFSGPLPMTANGAIVLDETNTMLWFATIGNFVINSSAAVQVSGEVYYKQE
jgi:hypothetical protein